METQIQNQAPTRSLRHGAGMKVNGNSVRTAIEKDGHLVRLYLAGGRRPSTAVNTIRNDAQQGCTRRRGKNETLLMISSESAGMAAEMTYATLNTLLKAALQSGKKLRVTIDADGTHSLSYKGGPTAPFSPASATSVRTALASLARDEETIDQFVTGNATEDQKDQLRSKLMAGAAPTL